MEQKEKFDVFISYRHSDAIYAARLMRDYLEKSKLKVFVDFGCNFEGEGIFEKHIIPPLKNSLNLLLLISPHTFASERIRNPQDWVGKEIKLAKSRDIPIIPVRLSPTVDLPREEDLPEEIRGIFNERMADYINCGASDDEYKAQMKRILARMNSTSGIVRQAKKETLAISVSKDEEDRLKTQVGLTSFFLRKVCENCADKLASTGKTNLRVLDVGCGDGELGRLCFEDKVFGKVNGIDINDTWLLRAMKTAERKNIRKKFNYDNYNIEDIGKSHKDLLKVLGDEQMKFDIIFCVMVLHHIKNDNLKHDKEYAHVIEIIKSFKQMLTPGGYLIISNPDDSSKLSCGDTITIDEKAATNLDDLSSKKVSALSELVQLTSKIPGVSDRHCGRATYYWLSEAGFDNIEIEFLVQESSRMNDDMKANFFKQSYSWQLDQIDRSHEAGFITTLEEKDKFKTEIERLTAKIKPMLAGKNSFWFSSIDYIGVAKNDG